MVNFIPEEMVQEMITDMVDSNLELLEESKSFYCLLSSFILFFEKPQIIM